MAELARRCEDGSLLGPTTVQAIIDSISGHACGLRPLGDAPALAADDQNTITSGIAVLNLPGGPDAEPRSIAQAVVDTLDRVLRRRPRSHVGQEDGERIPARIDCYSAATVVGPVRIRGIVTALEHRRPGSVFAELMTAVLVAVLGCETAATERASAFQIAANDDVFTSALTVAQPLDLTALDTVPLNNNEPTKLLASQVNQAHGPLPANRREL
jgi:hypothetical protein